MDSELFLGEEILKELHDLELLLRSQTPILVIESLEEPRLVQLFTRLGIRLGDPMFQWTITDGLRRLETDHAEEKSTESPADILKHIKSVSQAGIYVLLDFHPYLDDPLHIRLIKEIAQNYAAIPRTLVFVSHALDIPPELRHLTAKFNLHLPDNYQIRSMIKDEVQLWQQKNPGKQFRADREALDRLSTYLLGVTLSDTRRLIRTAIRDDGAITYSDLDQVMRSKYELIGQDGLLSFEYDTARFTDVAGLEQLKTWLLQREPAFKGQAGSLDRPKGIMLLGVQGSGKSLAAKAVAGQFGVPLLRLDFASLYNKFYGETEKNLRQALQTAEVMAPCILWIDEIEKGLAPSDSDEGLSRRILGTLLTWMAENKTETFIVATSNDIARLPPELIRKGRLDEIFFIDLPDNKTRKAIFEIHLRQRNLAPSGFNLDLLAEASDSFSGAEIEQAIVSALYAAHHQQGRLNNQLLLDEIGRTQPLAVVMAERIAELRLWARERTVAAG